MVGDRELELARAIQLSLLPPHLPEVAGLSVNAFSHRLFERLREWRGDGPFEDDVTFVVVDIR